MRDRAVRVWLNARDGLTLAVRRAGELPALHRWIETADLLHFRNFGWLWSKLILFVFGLAISMHAGQRCFELVDLPRCRGR